jgi:hypothetical protein
MANAGPLLRELAARIAHEWLPSGRGGVEE